MGKDEEVIARWESGDEAPTYSQLERLAYTVYKRPLATFFLPEPPVEEDMQAEFRVYLGGQSNRLNKDTLLAIRDARVRQYNLEEFYGASTAAPSFLRGVNSLINSRSSLLKTAADVRSDLKISEEQVSQAPSADAAMELWRTAIERKGIFVFKRAFKQDNISGFCLRHDQFPLIYINNKTSFTRQTFTLAHELCHLAMDVSGVCAIDDEYPASLKGSDRRTEEYCDAFAAEVLVPTSSFQQLGVDPMDEVSLRSAARYFKVSPAVLARKSLDLGLIDLNAYRLWMRRFFPDNWRAKTDDESRGGNYYNTQLQYISRTYLLEAYRQHAQGRMSDQAFADYLGVKVSSLSEIESRLLNREGSR